MVCDSMVATHLDIDIDTLLITHTYIHVHTGDTLHTVGKKQTLPDRNEERYVQEKLPIEKEYSLCLRHATPFE